MTFRVRIIKNSPNICLESGRIKQEKCYCLPPRDASSILTGYGLSGGKQVGEGCTKVPDIDPENIPGVEGNTPQQ